MKPLYKLALIIAILVAIWVYITLGNPQLKLNPWVGFVGWAAYFAAGGNMQAAKCSLLAGITAILLTAVTLYSVQIVGGGLLAMMILFPILAFTLVAMAQFTSLSYTPGAFLGASCFFGTGGNVDITIVYVILSWVAGIGLGIATINLDKWSFPKVSATSAQ